MWRRVVCWVGTDVSEEHIAPAFLLLTCWFLLKLFSSTLKMEAVCSSETSVSTQHTTRRHIPENDTLQLFELFRSDRMLLLTLLTPPLQIPFYNSDVIFLANELIGRLLFHALICKDARLYFIHFQESNWNDAIRNVIRRVCWNLLVVLYVQRHVWFILE
jgi:hypothetical protein